MSDPSRRRDGVLVVSPTFYPEAVGTPHYVADLVRELQRRGDRPRVVTAMPYYPAFERFEGYGRSRRRDRFEGAPVYRLPTLVPRRGATLWRAANEVNFFVQAVLARLLGRVPSAERVIAVSPGVPLAVLAAVCLRKPRGRTVAVVHDVAFGLAQATTGLGDRLAGLLRASEVMFLNRADAVIALSPAMAKALVEAGVVRPVEVIPLWPTVPLGASSPAGTGPPCVLYSGNIGRKQGVERLLDLAERLHQQAPNVKLVIRGEGSERRMLEAEARRRRLANVDFHGFVPEEELSAALAAAHVHVVPQLPEGATFAVPSKVVNILAVGRPVVVTAGRGSPLALLGAEVPAVRCVDPGDGAALAAEVVRLLSDPDLCRELGEAGHRWVEAGHTREAAAERLIELLG